MAERSKSVRMSPLQTMNRSSMPAAAKRMPPAVPSGLGSDRVRQADTAAATVGEVGLDRVGQVADREHDLVDAVRLEPRELAFEERLVGDRQQRLRRRERERAQARALAPHEDDRLHGVEVVVAPVVEAAGALVVVAAGAVVDPGW